MSTNKKGEAGCFFCFDLSRATELLCISLLGLDDLDDIGEGVGGALLSFGVRRQHDLDLDTEDTLLEEHVTNTNVDEVLGGLTGLDHVAVAELHGLSTLAAELTRNLNFTTLGLLHDLAEDTIASTTNGDTVEQLEAEGLGLGEGRQATEGNTLGIKLDGAISQAETLLDHRGQLTNAAALLSQDVLGTGGTNDHLSALGRLTNLNSGISVV